MAEPLRGSGRPERRAALSSATAVAAAPEAPAEAANFCASTAESTIAALGLRSCRSSAAQCAACAAAAAPWPRREASPRGVAVGAHHARDVAVRRGADAEERARAALRRDLRRRREPREPQELPRRVRAEAAELLREERGLRLHEGPEGPPRRRREARRRRRRERVAEQRRAGGQGGAPPGGTPEVGGRPSGYPQGGTPTPLGQPLEPAEQVARRRRARLRQLAREARAELRKVRRRQERLGLRGEARVVVALGRQAGVAHEVEDARRLEHVAGGRVAALEQLERGAQVRRSGRDAPLSRHSGQERADRGPAAREGLRGGDGVDHRVEELRVHPPVGHVLQRAERPRRAGGGAAPRVRRDRLREEDAVHLRAGRDRLAQERLAALAGVRRVAGDRAHGRGVVPAVHLHAGGAHVAQDARAELGRVLPAAAAVPVEHRVVRLAVQLPGRAQLREEDVHLGHAARPARARQLLQAGRAGGVRRRRRPRRGPARGAALEGRRQLVRRGSGRAALEAAALAPVQRPRGRAGRRRPRGGRGPRPCRQARRRRHERLRGAPLPRRQPALEAR